MAITNQVRLLRAVRDVMSGEGPIHLYSYPSEPKPKLAPPPHPIIPLEKSTPEAEGVPSGLLADFYRAVADNRDCHAHSLLVLRHGRLISEGYFAPYRPGVWQVVHSIAKTFTGTAVGMAEAEGLLGLDDIVADHFPEKLSMLTSRKLRKITVRHLLNMSSGLTFNEVSEAIETDWVRGIFSETVAFEPGSRFSYNSLNSYLLSALVQRVSGQTLMEFLTPRLFQPMGFGPVAWESCPAGINKGGWGIYVTPEDLAKMGQLYLQKGRWTVGGKAKQLLPASWVEQATQVQNRGDKGEEYGYQFWVDSEHQTYVMNGLFCQYVLVVPRLDLVIAMTSGNASLFTDSPAYRIMQDTFYGLELDDALPENPRALAGLTENLDALRFHHPWPGAFHLPKRLHPHKEHGWAAPAPAQNLRPAALDSFCNTTWKFEPNLAGMLPIAIQGLNNNFTAGFRSLRVDACADDGVMLLWHEGETAYHLPVGMDKPIDSTLVVGKDSFLVSASGVIRDNEDGDPVFIIEICFLEHSSYRQLKLQHHKGRLLLRFDEEPQLSTTLENMMLRSTTGAPVTDSHTPAPPPSFGELVYSIDYVHYRVTCLCMPRLLGVSVPNLLQEDGRDGPPYHATTPT